MPSLDGIESEAEFIAYVDKFRQDVDSKFIEPLSQALAGAFPVDIGAIKMMSKRIPHRESCAAGRNQGLGSVFGFARVKFYNRRRDSNRRWRVPRLTSELSCLM
jgi:hypothetical protein